MSSEEGQQDRNRKWVRVERRRGPRDEDAEATIHIPLPGEKMDPDLRKARRELVRVEKKFLRSMVRSRELPESAKHEVQIRLRELEGEE